MVEYQVRTQTENEFNGTQNDIDTIASGEQTAIIDYTGECFLGGNESASIEIEVLNDGTTVAIDSDSGSTTSGGSDTLSISLNGTFTFDDVLVKHSGDGILENSYSITRIYNELDNVKGEETINPFGDRYIMTFRDVEGRKFNSLSINDAVDVFAREPTPSGQANDTFQQIFDGYIVDLDGYQEGKRDVLDVTAYTFDQLIRNESVSNDQTDKRIDAILKDIIETDTPVEWVAGNVAVQDNRQIGGRFKVSKLNRLCDSWHVGQRMKNMVSTTLRSSFSHREKKPVPT